MSDPQSRLREHLLLMRCQIGDEDAYRELVDNYTPRLGYFLRKLVERNGNVDDLVQDVWIDVWRQLPRLHDLGAFRTWLYRIARGKAMLDFRHNGREPKSSPDVVHIAEDEPDVFSPEDVAEVHLALDRLEPIHREALVLRFLEDLSYAEIGQICGCPVGTARSRVHYAKERLRRILQASPDRYEINKLHQGEANE